MTYQWVVGKYTGKQAGSIEAHALAGIGYVILDSSGKGHNKTVVAAFKSAIDKPLEHHLQIVTDQHKIDKYEKIASNR